MTPRQMVAGVMGLAKDWEYDMVSIGYPGPVLPKGCRAGDNTYAFLGGFRLWDKTAHMPEKPE